jgi:capsular polysaccharide biosynthesis protein
LYCPRSNIITLPHLSTYRVRKLWCASNPTYRGWYPSDWTSAWEGMVTDPENFATCINSLNRLAADALEVPTGVERVFFGRRPSRKKRLENHAQIEAIAVARGFKFVYPEDLPFLEQIRLARHARHIIAPDGSNGLLSYFASPSAKVCFLNHTHTLPLAEINGLLEALGIEFTIFTGPTFGEPKQEPYWNDYLIDENRFADFLDQWLSPGAKS